MRPPILIALVLVLGTTLWLSTQTVDTVELAKDGDGSSVRGRRVEPVGPEAARQQASGVTSSTDARESWVLNQISQGVRQWRQRQADATSLMSVPALSAWAPVRQPMPATSVSTAVVPAPEPVAPPFPHKWIGRINDAVDPARLGASAGASVSRAVLAGPVATWVVREGDVIEHQWRVDQIQDRTMSLTYLPLRQSQTVVMK